MDECGCEPVKFYLQTGGKSGFSLQAIVCQPLLSTPFRMHLAYHNSDPLIPPHKRLPVLPQIQIKFLVMTCRVICGLPLLFFLASSPVTLPACTVYWLCHPIVPCCLSLACFTRAWSFCRKGPENLGSTLFASLVFSHSSRLHSELTSSRKPSLPASSLD